MVIAPVFGIPIWIGRGPTAARLALSSDRLANRDMVFMFGSFRFFRPGWLVTKRLRRTSWRILGGFLGREIYGCTNGLRKAESSGHGGVTHCEVTSAK